MNSHHFLGLGAAAAVLGLSGCIYTPRTTQTFDEECQTQAHHMSLEREEQVKLMGCTQQGCAALLVAAGLVTVASAVVSGSIVVVGNVVYWFEKQGRCAR
jgi:hypothetical protein